MRNVSNAAISNFERVWDKLAAAGTCDERFGMEYARLYKQWVTADQHEDPEVFIKREANKPSPKEHHAPKKNAHGK
jgi:hypothetical protein